MLEPVPNRMYMRKLSVTVVMFWVCPYHGMQDTCDMSPVTDGGNPSDWFVKNDEPASVLLWDDPDASRMVRGPLRAGRRVCTMARSQVVDVGCPFQIS